MEREAALMDTKDRDVDEEGNLVLHTLWVREEERAWSSPGERCVMRRVILRRTIPVICSFVSHTISDAVAAVYSGASVRIRRFD